MPFAKLDATGQSIQVGRTTLRQKKKKMVYIYKIGVFGNFFYFLIIFMDLFVDI
jgi:hypothetical protein